MMNFKKNTREVYFLLNRQDADDLLKHLGVLLKMGEAVFEVFDEEQEKVIKVTLFKNNADAEEAKLVKNEVQMWFTDDVIEYCEFKIKEFIRLGYISPAEFFEFSDIADASKKKSIRTYFMMKATASPPPCPIGDS